jgi:hypothetical protein
MGKAEVFDNLRDDILASGGPVFWERSTVTRLVSRLHSVVAGRSARFSRHGGSQADRPDPPALACAPAGGEDGHIVRGLAEQVPAP